MYVYIYIYIYIGKVNLLERRWDPLEYHIGLGTGMTLSAITRSLTCLLRVSSCVVFICTFSEYIEYIVALGSRFKLHCSFTTCMLSSYLCSFTLQTMHVLNHA